MMKINKQKALSVRINQLDDQVSELVTERNFKDAQLADLLTSLIINETEDFAQISIRYQAYSKNDWEDLLELLNGCYSHRANLIWRQL